MFSSASRILVPSLVLLPALVANALPLERRIAQVITDATRPWVAACQAAGGGTQCQPASQAAFMSLLAGAGSCDQQNAADGLLDLADTLGGSGSAAAVADMRRLAQVFVQQPRNSPDKLSAPYCQTAPRHAELQGLFHCQFEGVNPKVFFGNVPVGGPGTIPLGLSAAVNPPSSCAAHPQGGIPDGMQLVDQTQDPGVASSGSSSSGAANAAAGDASSSSAPAADPSTSGSSPDTANAPSGADPSTSGSTADTAGAPSSSSSSPAGDFHLQNGKDAQALNAKFATLTATSSCNSGDDACIAGAFAQCVNGKFVTTACAATTQCFALPLVNKPGTSITCTTPADAAARITATGATGGVSGSA